MTSREFIKLIQDADPEGDAVMDLGGFITNVIKLPAWYDGKAPIIENNVLKRINTGSKISVSIQCVEDFIYDYIDGSDKLINNYNNCIILLDESISNRENKVKKYILDILGIDSVLNVRSGTTYVSRPNILFMPDGYKNSDGKVNNNGLFQFIQSNPQFMEAYNGFIKFKPITDEIYKFLPNSDNIILFNGLILTDMITAYRVHFDGTWKICDFVNEYEFDDFILKNNNLVYFDPRIHSLFKN